ncbi:hypothetical protein MPSEU_000663300 [Mayamaea pseudoterrestris]|nr:hypothetical protein MPSEU_000663300 [Mayamaea pseudoterrestris]
MMFPLRLVTLHHENRPSAFYFHLAFVLEGKTLIKRSRMPNEKRKRLRNEETTASARPSPEQDYYDRLIHQCRKDLSKQLKVCKSFECQKLIRKIKATEEKQSVEKMQQTYETLKQMSIEPVLDKCLRRIGVSQLNPNGYEPPKHESNDASNDKWVEKLLEHKRMQQSMESWSEQATDFRKWCLKRLERQDEDERGEHNVKRKKLSKNDKTEILQQRERSDQGNVSSSMFVQLGAVDSDEPDGPAVPAVKKNRQGQRARKAKAAAIAAKEKGLPAPEKSLNWRETKPRVDAHDSHSHAPLNSGSDGRDKAFNRNDKPQHRGSINQKVSDEKLHPSWAAQKSKKEGIVTFQGTKVTFD